MNDSQTLLESSPSSVESVEEAGSLRELLRVGVPLMISSGSVSLMHIANRTFLTWESREWVGRTKPTP